MLHQKDNSQWEVNYRVKNEDFYGQALFVKDNQVVFWVVSEDDKKAKLENFKTGLMNDLLSGKKRVTTLISKEI